MSRPEATPELTFELLDAAGVHVDAAQRAQLNTHADLVRRHNEYASLVSKGDALRLESIHVPDALGLAPYYRQEAPKGALALDIGPGGGYPALPLAIALPEWHFILIERSEKKMRLLQDMAKELGLENVAVVWGQYPEMGHELTPKVVTARAVERPERVRREILKHLRRAAVFLSQGADPTPLAGPMFHVEHLRDALLDAGLRRGGLYRVRRVS